MPEQPLTAKGRRTQTALTAAARKVFERDGFVNARVTDITKEAGVAHGTFYSYFDSKETVFQVVILEFMDHILQQSHSARNAASTSPYGAICAANRSYALVFRENARLMLLWQSVADSNVVLAELLQQQKEAFVSRAERGIRRLQKQRLAEPQPDARYAAKALGSMVNEFCSQWLGHNLDYDFETAVDTLNVIWARAIGLAVLPTEGYPEPSIRLL